MIANAGLTSRRKAEEWILAGRVRVNGKVVRTLGVTVDPEADQVTVGGTLVRSAPRRTVVLYKPVGCLTTLSDPKGRTTVMDLLPRGFRKLGLRPVGRLDRDAEGLLILTNDGGLSQRVAHPSSGCEKEYHVRVRGRLSPADMSGLRRGIVIEGRRTSPCKARLVRHRREGSEVSLILQEGRNRQIKRMMLSLGHPVSRLRRVRIGGLRLEGLRRGAWREIRQAQLDRLFPHPP